MKNRKLLVLGSILLLLTGCGVNNTVLKTEYGINENAKIDHYEIICTDSVYLNQYNDKSGKFLKVNYTLTNKSNSLKTVQVQSDFKIYKDENLISPISSDKLDLNAGETKDIEVIFEITEHADWNNYKIIFYSNVVTNNIAFVIEN